MKSQLSNYLKNEQWNSCTYREEYYQYISKKYYAICLIKNRIYIDYEDLLLKYTSNCKYLLILIY